MLEVCLIHNVIEAGCDEAGRGPLAGSVFAAAVILPPSFQEKKHVFSEEWQLLNDSKQLTENERERLRPIIEQEAAAWAVAEVTAEEIDRINILNAAILAMHKALGQLKIRPQHIIVDGNRFKPYIDPDSGWAVPYRTVVKGDGKYMSIAAASVLAKTHRDENMRRLAEQYPQYDWQHNMGYPTPKHREAIKQFGLTPYHRLSFNTK